MKKLKKIQIKKNEKKLKKNPNKENEKIKKGSG